MNRFPIISRQPVWRIFALAIVTSIVSLAPVTGQNSAATASRGTAAGGPGGISGSVPTGVASHDVLQLTLPDAINQALQYNLAAVESGDNARIARGQRLVALSKLLPQVSAAVSEHVQQVDLATIGLKSPAIPRVVGPYSYSSADGFASLTLFNFESIERLRSTRTAEQAAQLNYQDVLDMVTLAVGNAYLEGIEAESRIEAQEAQVRNARALYEKARDEVDAGTAPAIDRTRTEVQLQAEEYSLSSARNDFAIAKLNLARAIGLPLGQEFALADQLPYSDINPPTLGDALATAYQSRSDLRAELNTEKAAAQSLSAAKAERYPVIATGGNYGVVGPTFGHSHGEFTFQAGVSVPLFTGGRIKGDIAQAEATHHQRKSEVESLRGQIDYDVRTAFLNLNAAKEQVAVARRGVDLANESLNRSKDRFSSGVTDSVEVVQAQQALASANDQYITSLYFHNLAKLSLARSIGMARSKYNQFLGGN
jgi:outer membrane protein TolC